MMKRKFLILMAMALFVVGSIGTVSAAIIDLQGVNFPGSIFAVADFNYVPLTATTGNIDVTMSNTSTVISSLTAFAFNAPTNVTGVNSFSGPNADWSAVYSPDSINTPGQFGMFDLASITGPNFNGGDPLNGIWTGNSGDFVIGITGTGMFGLTTNSFLSLVSDLGGKVGTAENFIARLQAIGSNDGSDVAIPGGHSVPEPATLLLLGCGIVGLVAGRRKVKLA